MEVKNFTLTEKEVKQVSVALTMYVHDLAKLGISLDEKPELRNLLDLFSPCLFSIYKS